MARPLAGLALRDAEVAATLFEQIFAQLYAPRSADKRAVAAAAITRVLEDPDASRSAEVVSALLRACLAAAWSSGVVEIPVATIAESAARARVFESGAALIEAMTLARGAGGTCARLNPHSAATGESRHNPPRSGVAEIAELRRLYTAASDQDAELAACDTILEGDANAPARRALEAAARGDYDIAKDLYRDLGVQQGGAPEEANRIAHARRVHMALELGRWNDAVLECVASAGGTGDDDDDDEGLWRRSLGATDVRVGFDAAETLQAYVTAVAHRRVDTENRLERLLTRVEGDAERKIEPDAAAEAFVAARAPCALAIASLRKSDFGTARRRVDAAYESIGATLASLHRCAIGARSDRLRELARVAEIDTFLSIRLSAHEGSSAELARRWRAMPLGARDPADHWMRCPRSRYFCAISVLGSDTAFAKQPFDDIKKHTKKLKLETVRLALARGDLDVAVAAYEESKGAAAALFADVSLARARRHVARRDDPRACSTRFEEALHDPTSDNEPTRVAEYFAAVASGAAVAPEQGGVDALGQKAARNLVEGSREGSGQLDLAEFVFGLLRRDIANGRTRLAVLDNIASLASRMVDEDAIAACVDVAVRSFIEALEALNATSVAQRAVPRLIALITEWTASAAPSFKEAATPAVCVGFLPWCWRLVSLATTGTRDLRDALLPTLATLAKEYPGAMRDHVRFAVERSEDERDETEAWLADLQRHCHDEAAESLVVALEGLAEPEIRAYEGFQRIANMLRADETAEKMDDAPAPKKLRTARAVNRRVARAWARLRDNLFADSWPHVGPAIGERNAHFATLWIEGVLRNRDARARRQALADEYGHVPEKMRKFVEGDLSHSGFSDHWSSGGCLCAEMATAGEARKLAQKLAWFFHEALVLEDAKQGSRRTRHVPLQHVSKHLRDYDGARGGAGLRAPGDEASPRVFAFDPTVVSLRSLRRPKKLTMHCADGEARSYLVKGGEDLRNDARIQAIFGAMRRELDAGVKCSGGLLRVYGVVALNPRVGLVEWVDGVETLKSIIERDLGDADTANSPMVLARVERDNALNITGARTYLDAYRHQPPARAVEALEAAYAQIDASPNGGGALRRHLAALAPLPEAWLALRSKYVQSLACASACGYVVGLGDRHLDNLMLDRKNGSILHIDLGVSFGGGPTLPIPELLPFRLTRELRAPLAPLNSDALLRRNLAANLAALRAQDARPTLETMLEAFATDPVLEWIQNDQTVNKRQRSDGTPDVAAKLSPHLRVQVATGKLRGTDPAVLLNAELRCNTRLDDAVLGRVVAVVHGAHKPPAPDAAPLSPDEQAAALIRLATDKALLGFQWQGLNTWL